MQLTMHINMDNSAFEDDMELARIVAGVYLATRGINNTIAHDFEVPLKDSNGNPVGSYKVENVSNCGKEN